MIGTDLEKAAGLLRSGGLVGLPTETVYGLAAHGLDPLALEKIFVAKGRPKSDPLILHVKDLHACASLVSRLPDALERLCDAFWPGPLTILAPKSPLVPDEVTSGLPRVALRSPAHPVARALLSRLDFPLAAPSANPFGYVSPVTAAHVEAQLGDRIDYVLDGGPCEVGVESTIVGIDPDGTARVHRPGGVGLEAIRSLLGDVRHRARAEAVQAPGELESHYAPRARVILCANRKELLEAVERNPEAEVLAFGDEKGLPAKGRNLSPAASPAEAARHLYSFLRAFDEAGVSLVLAESLPAEGLGLAVNDRLRRASAPREHR